MKDYFILSKDIKTSLCYVSVTAIAMRYKVVSELYMVAKNEVKSTGQSSIILAR